MEAAEAERGAQASGTLRAQAQPRGAGQGPQAQRDEARAHGALGDARGEGDVEGAQGQQRGQAESRGAQRVARAPGEPDGGAATGARQGQRGDGGEMVGAGEGVGKARAYRQDEERREEQPATRCDDARGKGKACRPAARALTGSPLVGAMRALHVDGSNGIAGDMMLGALVAAGADAAKVSAVIDALGVGARVRFERDGAALRARVHAPEGLVHRGLPDIERLVAAAPLTPRARALSLDVFRTLAHAEAEVHGWPVEKVHFHEVGAADSLADIVGSCVALDLLGVEEMSASPLNLGSGVVQCAHGLLDVPPPAVKALLRGREPACYQEQTGFEMTTPTGAAILRALVPAERFGVKAPPLRRAREGLALGTHVFDRPRPLRVVVGERA